MKNRINDVERQEKEEIRFLQRVWPFLQEADL